MSESDGLAADDGAFRHVIENVAAGIAVLQDDRIAYVNPCAAKMLGREPATLIGIDLATLLSEEERHRPAESFAALVSGRVDEDYNEYRVALPDGRVRHLAVSARRIAWNGRAATLGVFHDISRQRAAMAALRGSEERYRTMVESLSEGVMIFDAQARLKGVNQAAQRLLGATFDPLRRNLASDWNAIDVDGNAMSADEIPIAVVLATGTPVRHAMLGMRATGDAVTWLDVNCEPLRDAHSGAVTGAVLSMTDVTEARRVAQGADRQRKHQPHADGRAGRRRLRRPGFPLRLCQPAAAGATGLRARRVRRVAVRAGDRAGFAGAVERALPRPRRHGRGAGAHLRGASSCARTAASPSSSWWPTAPRSRTVPAVLGVLRGIAELASAPPPNSSATRDRLEELVHSERTRELEAAVAARIQSENFAQTMTDHQPTLLAYVDREQRLQFVNRAWLNWFGKTREEVLGRDGRESVGDVMLRSNEDVIAKVLGGEAMGTPAEMRGVDGRVGNFWIYRMPDLVEGAIRGYFFIATDVTEMRRSERRLQELNPKLIQAESFTRGIADNLPERVAYWDADERCRFANRVYCEWFGKSLDQVLGKTTVEIFGEEQSPERLASSRRRRWPAPRRSSRPKRSARTAASASGRCNTSPTSSGARCAASSSSRRRSRPRSGPRPTCRRSTWSWWRRATWPRTRRRPSPPSSPT